MNQRHANICRPKRPGRPPIGRSIHSLILRLVRENPSWDYRRVHDELATPGIQIAASTGWEILKAEGIDPAPGPGFHDLADFSVPKPMRYWPQCDEQCPVSRIHPGFRGGSAQHRNLVTQHHESDVPTSDRATPASPQSG